MDVFQLFGKIAVDNSGAISAMEETSAHGESTESRMSTAFSNIGSAVASGFKTVVDWGAQLVTSSASAADNIDKMSQKIGISRQAYQELDFILSQSGASVESMQAGMRTMRTAMENGSDAFETLGISVRDSDGNLRNQEEVMWEAFAALQGMEDGAEKAALAQKLFGRAGTELMPLLNGQVGSIEELRRKAHELGLVMSDEAVDAGVEYTDAADQINRQITALKNNLGAKLLPMLTKLINKVTPIFAKIMPKLEAVFGNVVNAIEPLVEAISNGLGAAFDYLSEKFDGVFGDDGSIDWDKLGEGVADMFKDLGAKIPDLLRAVGDAIKTAWSKFVWPMIQGLFKSVFGIDLPDWETVKTEISNWWNNLKAKVDNIIRAVFGIEGGDTWENVKQKFTDWWDTTKKLVSGIFKALFGIEGGESWENVSGTFTKWWDTIKTFAGNIFKAIFGVSGGEAWTTIKDKFSEWWGTIDGKVKEIFVSLFGISGGETWENVKNVFSTWWNGIKDQVTAIFDAVWKLANGDLKWEDVKNIFVTWWNGISDSIRALFVAVFGIEGGETWDKIKQIFVDWWNGIVTNITNIFNAVWKLANGDLKWADVKQIFVDWWNGIVTNIKNVFGAVFSIAGGDKWNNIKDTISGWWAGIDAKIKEIFQAVFGIGGGEAWEKVKDVFVKWWNGITAGVTALFTAVWKLGEGNMTWDDVKQIFIDFWDKIVNAVTGVFQAVFGIKMPSIEDVVKSINDWWKDVTGQLTLGISAAWDTVTGWFGGGNKGDKKANGDDFIERDQQPAILHYGEAVLNRTDAKKWRDGSGTEGMMALADKMDAMITLLQGGVGGSQQIVLDTGVLVGATVGMYDSQMGLMAGRKGRGN